MPASRSRTEHWRESLNKVFERGGALEISVDRGNAENADPARGADLVWRVKVLRMTDSTIVIEPPAACGATIPMGAGVRLVAAMSIGQNRWMFHTQTLGQVDAGPGRPKLLVLQMPTGVERCTRRDFYRISTADLKLPRVQCWPLLDPTSIRAPEAANRAQITDLSRTNAVLGVELDQGESILLPEVGPMFNAQLLNVSGGGLGLLLSNDDTRVLSSRPFIWLRLDLRPDIPAPIAVTARVAHTHIDSGANLYAGLAFDFTHNADHRTFVVDQFAKYIQGLSRRQGGSSRAQAA
ncbi:MAG: PilZ domain-containing protein [Phycisphaerales bacterium]|nr:PilZ domain-containing protein [Phycisphaerales bacterium]